MRKCGDLIRSDAKVPVENSYENPMGHKMWGLRGEDEDTGREWYRETQSKDALPQRRIHTLKGGTEQDKQRLLKTHMQAWPCTAWEIRIKWRIYEAIHIGDEEIQVVFFLTDRMIQWLHHWLSLCVASIVQQHDRLTVEDCRSGEANEVCFYFYFGSGCFLFMRCPSWLS